MFPHYSAKNLFFADLINRTFTLPGFVFIALFIINGVLIWFIGKRILRGYGYIPLVIYLLSPWFYYLTVAGSFYMFLLFLVLLITLGLTNILSGNKTAGMVLVAVGTLIASYSSPLLFLLLPLLFLGLIGLKIFSLPTLKTTIVFILILIIPLLFLIGKNKIGFRNSLVSEIKTFSDPGLLNSINRYQGAADLKGYKLLSRVSENKYLFFAEYSALKYATQLMPGTFFTPQHKLLGFSFNPPILLGFLFPFIYGLYKALRNKKLRWIIFVSTLLVVPSILGKDIVSLNRLLIFSPVIVFITSFGIAEFFADKNNKTVKAFSLLAIVLVLFQLIVVLSDIRVRELQRFERHLGTDYQLKEP